MSSVIGIHTANALRGYEVGQLARARGAYVVFGGIHATLYPNEAHAQGGAHAVVRGDGDVTWATVIDDCAAGTPREVYEAGQIAGATFKPARWDRLPKDRYMWASIQTVRGCPKHCSFCSVWRTDGQTPRQANIHNVLNEAVELRRRGFRFIALADDNFYPVTLTDLTQAARRSDPSQLRSLEAVRAERFALMDGLAKLPDDMVFFTQITMEAAEDPEYLQAMARARIKGALVGVEAVTPEGLKDVHKGFNLVGEALVERLQAFRSHGVHVLGSFIFGLPSDRAATFEATADLAERAGITFAQFVMLTPYPGYHRFRALGTRAGWRRHDRRWHSHHAALAHPAGEPSEGLCTASRDVARRNSASHAGGVGPLLFPAKGSGADRVVVKTWKARLAFVLSSKLYRQMYASTGIATDSARRTRSARVARWMAGAVPPALCRRPDAAPRSAPRLTRPGYFVHPRRMRPAYAALR